MTGDLAEVRDGKLDVLALLEAYGRGDEAALDTIASTANGPDVTAGMFALLVEALKELTPDSPADWIARKRAELLAAEAAGG